MNRKSLDRSNPNNSSKLFLSNSFGRSQIQHHAESEAANLEGRTNATKNQSSSRSNNEGEEEYTDSPMMGAISSTSNSSSIFNTLREMQAEMKNLSTKEQELFLSSHDENSDMSILVDDHQQQHEDDHEEVNRKCKTGTTFEENDDIQLTDVEEHHTALQQAKKALSAINSSALSFNPVHQLLEKHRRENEQRRRQGSTPFVLESVMPCCSDDESTQVDLSDVSSDNETAVDHLREHETEATNTSTIDTSNKQVETTKMSSAKLQEPMRPKSVTTTTTLSKSLSNSSRKPQSQITTTAIQTTNTQSRSSSPKIPSTSKSRFPSTHQHHQHSEEERIKLEKKKRDLEKDVLLKDSERRIASLTRKLTEYEELFRTQEEKARLAEKEKDIELKALRDLYEEKWLEFKNKEKDWDEKISALISESSELSIKIKKQNEQLIQLRQKLQTKTDETQQLQKAFKEKENEWKEKEKTYLNIQKRYNELLSHSRDIKKHSEQVNAEMNDLKKANEEFGQKLSDLTKLHASKVKEMKEKIEQLNEQ